MKSINPATEQIIAEYPDHNAGQVEEILRRAEDAFAEWRDAMYDDRARLMSSAARVLRYRRGDLATLMTSEMGKTLGSAEAEVDKCASACDYFASAAGELLATRDVESDATRSMVRYDPLGPVLAIMPWNFPLWQVFRFAAPGLMAGNVGLLKHASNVPGCALAIEEVFREAGFPPGIFTALLISGQDAEKLIEHPIIRAVTLTGSESAGQHVAAAAGKAIKKSVLELGGSDPFIVIPPVDIESTAGAAAAARCINNGQSCIAAKRFLVHESIAEEFEEAFVAEMAGLRVGDPMDEKTQIGPLARPDLRADLHDQVQRSIAAGAKLLIGGKVLTGRGYYYPPTILSNVRPGIPAFDEETFGPVAAVIRYNDIDEAVALANRSKFGLGSSIWTDDIELAEEIVPRIEAGSVFINGPVKSDPRLPFGGVKHSGYGRELSEIGIREFVNIKTVWIRDNQQPGDEESSE